LFRGEIDAAPFGSLVKVLHALKDFRAAFLHFYDA
jgi:hypothetical protein